MSDIFFEGKEDDGSRIFGITEYVTSTIYIDKDIDGYLLGKTLRHELTHIYLWETAQQDREWTEEELCDLMGVIAPIIAKSADDIMLRLREGLYKKGEQK